MHLIIRYLKAIKKEVRHSSFFKFVEAVMKDGRIIDTGKYGHLTANSSMYHSLQSSQSGLHHDRQRNKMPM